MDTHSILVGVDFSPSSRRALDHAVSLAKQLGGDLHLLYVYPYTISRSLSDLPLAKDDVAQLAASHQRLVDLAAEAVPKAIRVYTYVRIGDPVRGALDEIAGLQPDLVVVGSHGRGLIGRTLLGSVSERLVRRSPVPVLVVPAEERAVAAQATDEEHPAPKLAAACVACGHIRGAIEPKERCVKCGADPAEWTWAATVHGPVDIDGPAIGQETVHESGRPNTYSSAGLSTQVGGTSGSSVNPELRVRY